MSVKCIFSYPASADSSKNSPCLIHRWLAGRDTSWSNLVCVCVSVCVTRVEWWSTIRFVFWDKSLTGLRLDSSAIEGPSCFCLQMLGLQACTPPYYGFGGSNSSPHACTTRTLLTEPSYPSLSFKVISLQEEQAYLWMLEKDSSQMLVGCVWSKHSVRSGISIF